ncbi:hypothetical protein C5601_22490 [Klebsiella pneumoniae]|nr:hypothetical protein [Klebsiella pneumoniae]
MSLGDKISPFFAEALPNGALIRNFIFQALSFPRDGVGLRQWSTRPRRSTLRSGFSCSFFRWFLSICMHFFNNGTWQ